MTIIFSQGNNFWIESLIIPVTLVNSAGGTSQSAVITLEKPGDVLGLSTTASDSDQNDNVQAIGLVILLDQGSDNIVFGENITGVRIRLVKQAGTDGNITMSFHVLLFMRGRRSES